MPDELHNLYLLVAGDCNLACSYCYAQQGRLGNGPAAMAPATLRRALETLVPEYGSLVVSFFGGEPLLDLDLLRQAVAWGDAIGAERGTRLHYALTTNGTLLDDERLAFIQTHIAHVAVSLDGAPALTDAHRRFKVGGRSVGRTVLRNLRRLQRAGVRYGLRGTLSEGMAAELDGAAEFLSGLAPAAIRIDAASGAKAWRRDHRREWSEAVCRLNARQFDRLLAGEPVAGPLGDIYRCAAHRLHGQRRRYPCLAGQGILAVDAGGDVYPCDHFVGEAAFRMGNVHDDAFPCGDYRRVAGHLKDNAVERRPTCAHCHVRHACGGECPAVSLKRQGDIAIPSPDHCAHVRRVERHVASMINTALADPQTRQRLADAFRELA